MKDRKDKSRRLARTGLGKPNAVALFHHCGNERALDRCRGREAFAVYTTEDSLVQAEVFKGRQKEGILSLIPLNTAGVVAEKVKVARTGGQGSPRQKGQRSLKKTADRNRSQRVS